METRNDNWIKVTGTARLGLRATENRDSSTETECRSTQEKDLMMGKFKEMVTTEMTTRNVAFENAMQSVIAKIEAEFTPEKNAARIADLQAKQRAEMEATPRGRHFLRKQGVIQ